MELAGTDADRADATAVPAKVIAAIEKVATAVGSTSFVVDRADNFPFEFNIVVSPMVTWACRRDSASCDSIHGSHAYVSFIDDVLNIWNA